MHSFKNKVTSLRLRIWTFSFCKVILKTVAVFVRRGSLLARKDSQSDHGYNIIKSARRWIHEYHWSARKLLLELLFHQQANNTANDKKICSIYRIYVHSTCIVFSELVSAFPNSGAPTNRPVQKLRWPIKKYKYNKHIKIYHRFHRFWIIKPILWILKNSVCNPNPSSTLAPVYQTPFGASRSVYL